MIAKTAKRENRIRRGIHEGRVMTTRGKQKIVSFIYVIRWIVQAIWQNKLGLLHEAADCARTPGGSE